ncbi:MAG: hypothetical protein C0474_07840 [Sphingobium sp.]|jgi:hypothetical protein|nr:hypothetical protein [Sphingobium sp.]
MTRNDDTQNDRITAEQHMPRDPGPMHDDRTNPRMRDRGERNRDRRGGGSLLGRIAIGVVRGLLRGLLR